MITSIVHELTGGVPNPDRVIILSPREALRIPFDVGVYSRVRVMMFISTTALGNPNAIPVNETVSITGELGLCVMGFKNNTPDGILHANTQYIGLYRGSGATLTASPNVGSVLPTMLIQNALVGTIGGGANSFDIYAGTYNGGEYAATNHNARLFVAEFQVYNKGQTGNQLAVFRCTAGDGAPQSADLTTENCRVLGESATLQFASSSLNWFEPTGANTPYPMPGCFYIRWPFNNTRLRIHAMAVSKMT